MGLIQTMIDRREMLTNLVGRELKSRYKGSVLGFLWTVLTPLFMAVIYVFFLRLLARGVPMESVIIGIFAWQFTAMSVNSGLVAITGNSNLVKKVFFPRIILPTASTLANLVNYVFSVLIQIVLVIVLLAVKDQAISWFVVFVPLLIIYHTIFNLALAYFLSSANVYFRDFQHLVGVLLTAWFFASPSMYDLEMSILKEFAVSHPLLMDIYMLNPMAVINTGYRALMLPETQFPWSPLSILGIALPFILLGIGYLTFRRLQRNFADLL